MKNIKLYIGEVNYPQNKIAWIPTIDSVLNTQRFLPSKFLYRSVIIFRKTTMQDISYPMTNSIYYSTSEFDSLLVHNGTTGNIIINENAYYFDGTYYYYYLVMYSNTFDLWNVVNNNSIYAILYDQTNVTIQGGSSYIMNEFRITKNVVSLNISGGSVSNVYTLILPNTTLDITEFATYTQFVNLTNFQLFDLGINYSTQEVSTFKGLLYTLDYSELIAIPVNYQGETIQYRSSKTASTTTTTRINLHSECIYIRNLAFNDDSSGNSFINEIDEIYGENVMVVQVTGLAYTKIKSVRFPKLKSIGENAFTGSTIEKLYLPNTVADVADNFVDGCEQLTVVTLENNFDCNLTLLGANNINGTLFGQQFYHLLPQDKDYPKTIAVMAEVFNNIPQADKDYAASINWNIVEI